MQLKEKGKQGEELAKQYYQDKGYVFLRSNFTIQGGELDLLMKKGKNLVAIEVKYLDTIDEFDDYITPHKMRALERALGSFLQDVDDSEYDEIRIDVVLVKGGKVIEVYEDITGDF
ncbi:hypothetical protein AGMMS50249_7940 [candidate division SR1 bacterium]|nr:hypothetical protein AGMMS50249_7940 [candidate division SR1 bacterium]